MPPLEDLRAYRLGAIGGARLTFTDAAAVGDRLLYLAAAEASPDVRRDGPVVGVALGVLDGEGTRYALVHDLDGAPLADKAEGLAAHPTAPGRLLAVVDRDDPQIAAELLEIAIDGYGGRAA